MAFLIAGKMSFTEYCTLAMKYRDDRDYLPAREVSDQLAFLHSVIDSRIIDLSRDFHASQLRILGDRVDENSSMLRGIMAGRLAIVDDKYAATLGSRFQDYESVEPDLKEAVVIGYARAYNNLEAIAAKYRQSTTDEERIRLLDSMTMFKDPELLSQSLGMALSGEVKKQDVLTMILATIRNPQARQVVWEWTKLNVASLRKLSEGTGELSLFFQTSIPILGLGRVQEVEEFFDENRIPEAEKGISAGLEKLRIYQKLVDKISSETS